MPRDILRPVQPSPVVATIPPIDVDKEQRKSDLPGYGASYKKKVKRASEEQKQASTTELSAVTPTIETKTDTSKYVKLNTGEYVNKNEYDNLKADYQEVLKEGGVSKFKQYMASQESKFNDSHIKLKSGEFVNKADYDKLNPDWKAVLDKGTSELSKVKDAAYGGSSNLITIQNWENTGKPKMFGLTKNPYVLLDISGKIVRLGTPPNAVSSTILPRSWALPNVPTAEVFDFPSEDLYRQPKSEVVSVKIQETPQYSTEVLTKELRKADLPSYGTAYKKKIKAEVLRQSKVEDNNVRLSTGEYVPNSAFIKLGMESQAKLIELGVDKYNEYAGGESKKFLEDTVKLATGEYITKTSLNKLDKEHQLKLKELGIEQYNAYLEKEREKFEKENIKLGKGGWVSKKEYTKLSAEEKKRISELGVEGYNQYWEAQREEFARDNILIPGKRYTLWTPADSNVMGIGTGRARNLPGHGPPSMPPDFNWDNPNVVEKDGYVYGTIPDRWISREYFDKLSPAEQQGVKMNPPHPPSALFYKAPEPVDYSEFGQPRAFQGQSNIYTVDDVTGQIKMYDSDTPGGFLSIPEAISKYENIGGIPQDIMARAVEIHQGVSKDIPSAPVERKTYEGQSFVYVVDPVTNQTMIYDSKSAGGFKPVAGVTTDASGRLVPYEVVAKSTPDLVQAFSQSVTNAKDIPQAKSVVAVDNIKNLEGVPLAVDMETGKSYDVTDPANPILIEDARKDTPTDTVSQILDAISGKAMAAPPDDRYSTTEVERLVGNTKIKVNRIEWSSTGWADGASHRYFIEVDSQTKDPIAYGIDGTEYVGTYYNKLDPENPIKCTNQACQAEEGELMAAFAWVKGGGLGEVTPAEKPVEPKVEEKSEEVKPTDKPVESPKETPKEVTTPERLETTKDFWESLTEAARNALTSGTTDISAAWNALSEEAKNFILKGGNITDWSSISESVQDALKQGEPTVRDLLSSEGVKDLPKVEEVSQPEITADQFAPEQKVVIGKIEFKQSEWNSLPEEGKVAAREGIDTYNSWVASYNNEVKEHNAKLQRDYVRVGDPSKNEWVKKTEIPDNPIQKKILMEQGYSAFLKQYNEWENVLSNYKTETPDGITHYSIKDALMSNEQPVIDAVEGLFSPEDLMAYRKFDQSWDLGAGEEAKNKIVNIVDQWAKGKGLETISSEIGKFTGEVSESVKEIIPQIIENIKSYAERQGKITLSPQELLDRSYDIIDTAEGKTIVPKLDISNPILGNILDGIIKGLNPTVSLFKDVIPMLTGDPIIRPYDKDWNTLTPSEKQFNLDRYKDALLESAALTASIALPGTMAVTGKIGQRLLIPKALQRAAVSGSIFKRFAARQAMSIPKLAIGLAQFVVAGTPLAYEGAGVVQIFNNDNVESKWDSFKLLPTEEQNSYAKKAGYTNIEFSKLTPIEQAHVLAEYTVSRKDALGIMSSSISSFNDTLQNEMKIVSRNLPDSTLPWISEPVKVAEGVVGGIVEGISYIPQIPILGAIVASESMEDKGKPSAVAFAAAAGMLAFFTTEIPKAFIKDKSRTMGRMIGLFILHPATVAKMVKAGYLSSKNLVKGIQERSISIELSSERLFPPTEGKVLPKQLLDVIAKLDKEMVEGKPSATTDLGAYEVKLRNTPYQIELGGKPNKHYFSYSYDMNKYFPKGKNIWVGTKAELAKANLSEPVVVSHNEIFASPHGAPKFAEMGAFGQKQVKPGATEIITNRILDKPQKVLSKGEVEAEGSIKNVVLEYLGETTGYSPQLGEYPIRRYKVKGEGINYVPPSTIQKSKIGVDTFKETVLDFALGHKGRMDALKERFIQRSPEFESVEAKIENIKREPPELINKYGTFERVRKSYIHPELKGTVDNPGLVKPAVTAIVKNKNGGILLVKDQMENAWSLPGGQIDIRWRPGQKGFKKLPDGSYGLTPEGATTGQVESEVGFGLTNFKRKGIYLGKRNRHSLTGTYVLEAEPVGIGKIDRYKYIPSWSKGIPELKDAVWWYPDKKLTGKINPASYDILEGNGISVRNAKIDNSIAELNKARDKGYIKRAKSGNYLTQEEISIMKKAESKHLEKIQNDILDKENAPPSLRQFLTASDDIANLSEIIKGRRRALSIIKKAYPSVLLPSLIGGTALATTLLNQLDKEDYNSAIISAFVLFPFLKGKGKLSEITKIKSKGVSITPDIAIEILKKPEYLGVRSIELLQKIAESKLTKRESFILNKAEKEILVRDIELSLNQDRIKLQKVLDQIERIAYEEYKKNPKQYMDYISKLLNAAGYTGYKANSIASKYTMEYPELYKSAYTTVPYDVAVYKAEYEATPRESSLYEVSEMYESPVTKTTMVATPYITKYKPLDYKYPLDYKAVYYEKPYKGELYKTTYLVPPYETPPYAPPYMPIRYRLPPKIPPKTPPVPPGEAIKRYNRLTKEQKLVVIAWKQGIIYIVWYPNYEQEDVLYTREPIPGVEYHEGYESAYRSVARISTGILPADIQRRMGFEQIRVEKFGEYAEPELEFRLIPERTKRDIHSPVFKYKPNVKGERKPMRPDVYPKSRLSTSK